MQKLDRETRGFGYAEEEESSSRKARRERKGRTQRRPWGGQIHHPKNVLFAPSLNTILTAAEQLCCHFQLFPSSPGGGAASDAFRLTHAQRAGRKAEKKNARARENRADLTFENA